MCFQHPIMSEEDGNSGNNNVVSQITGNPSAIADLSRALIPTLISSLEETLASDKNGPGSLSNSQSEGEHSRQNISGGDRIMNPRHAHGFLSNYPPGNPAQQNQTYCAYQTGMGNAAPPFWGSAAQFPPGQCSPSFNGQLLPGQCSPTLW